MSDAKREKVLRVPVTPEEDRAIREKARQVGLPVAVFLRNVAVGYEVQSVLDAGCVKELARINADQGRLGGLLKMWLTNDERLKRLDGLDGPQIEKTIRAALAQLGRTQDQLFELASLAAKMPTLHDL